MNVFTDRLSMRLLFFITYYTFDVDLADFCRFTPGTIFYKEIVSTM